MKNAGLYLILPMTIFLFGGCSATQEEPLQSGIYLANMDTTVSPRNDFYRYVNGQWLDKTEIPADRVRWGSAHEVLETTEQQVLAIIQEMAAQDAEPGSNAQKIGDMYTSFMDTIRIENLGIAPLYPELERIEALSNHDELATFWGETQRFRFSPPIYLSVGQDRMQSDQYITSIAQSGLGLPDRDYYLNDDEPSRQLVEQYKNLITKFWDLAGWTDGNQAATDILEVERSIAQFHWTRVQNRDLLATYNKMSLSDLAATAPGFNWTSFVAAAGLNPDELVVRQPTYFTDFAGFYDSISIDAWKQYLRFHLIRSRASYLSSAFDEANFNFYDRILTGQEEQRSLENRGAAAVESVLGFMVGQEYVNRHFPQEASDRMDDMIGNLMVAFEQSIKELEWMSGETKAEALNKLAGFTAKIGYPKVWRDYECLSIRADDLIGNIRRSSACAYERSINRLGKQVDREEWSMTPQTVNAYYSLTLNEIVFPAAILQPPYFDVNAENAVNYGGIGAVIGHEISHGFDDQGRRFDSEGNLRDWWTAEDERQYNARAEKLIRQYSAFNPIDDLYLNGELGLGENIADLAGMNVAYRAYQNSLAGEEAPVIDGFTGAQRFFIGWGQIWRIKVRDEALRHQIQVIPHAPNEFRVLGIVSNMPEFYAAFDVQPGDPMYRAEDVRVRIW